LLTTPSNLALNTAREGAATASLGSLCQGLTTLTVKNFFLISNLNPPSQFKAITPCPVTTGPCKKSLSILPLGPLQVLEGCGKVCPKPSLLQAQQPQLSPPSSQERYSSPGIIFVASSGPAPKGLCLSCAEGK